VDNLKDLEKLLKLCRKQGVQSIRFDGVEVHLGDLPQPQRSLKAAFPEQTVNPKAYQDAFDPGKIIVPTDLKVPTDEMTEEQMMFGSSDPTVWKTN
jgi:hypothetical protein